MTQKIKSNGQAGEQGHADNDFQGAWTSEMKKNTKIALGSVAAAYVLGFNALYNYKFLSTDATIEATADHDVPIPQTDPASDEVAVFVDVYGRCSFSKEVTKVPDNGYIRFTTQGYTNQGVHQNVPVTLTFSEPPLPHLPDVDTDLSIDGGAKIKLDYPRVTVNPVPNMRMTCRYTFPADIPVPYVSDQIKEPPQGSPVLSIDPKR